MDDSELEEFKIKLTILMEAEKLYLDNELNLVKLAEKMNISGHQLSLCNQSGIRRKLFSSLSINTGLKERKNY